MTGSFRRLGVEARMQVIAVLVLTLSVTGCASGGSTTQPSPTGAPTSSTATASTTTSSTTTQGSSTTLMIGARDYSFTGLVDFAPKAGSTITVTMKNLSHERAHDFLVRSPEGKDVGGVHTTDPDAQQQGSFTVPISGRYTYLCTIGRHEQLGMKGSFTVT